MDTQTRRSHSHSPLTRTPARPLLLRCPKIHTQGVCAVWAVVHYYYSFVLLFQTFFGLITVRACVRACVRWCVLVRACVRWCALVRACVRACVLVRMIDM